MKKLLFLILIGFLFSCKKEPDSPIIPEKGTVTDIEGNVYITVKIGSQWWMTENLKTTKYSNGDLIGTTASLTSDITKETTPKYQWVYDGYESNLTKYGRLYTWYVVRDNRNVCPTGWIVPNINDWQDLASYLGTSSALWDAGQCVSSTKLEDTGFPITLGGTRWTSSNGIGEFAEMGHLGYWWTDEPYPDDNSVIIDATCFHVNGGVKNHAFSVRCLKD